MVKSTCYTTLRPGFGSQNPHNKTGIILHPPVIPALWGAKTGRPLGLADCQPSKTHEPQVQGETWPQRNRAQWHSKMPILNKKSCLKRERWKVTAGGRGAAFRPVHAHTLNPVHFPSYIPTVRNLIFPKFNSPKHILFDTKKVRGKNNILWLNYHVCIDHGINKLEEMEEFSTWKKEKKSWARNVAAGKGRKGRW